MKHLLVAAVILSFGCNALYAGPAPSGERPTWTQGDTWTYSDPIAHELKYTVLAAAADHYDVERIIGGSNRSVVGVDTDLYQKDNILVQFQWPLSQGASWKRVLTGLAPDGNPGPWEVMSVVEAFETVVTPAGSFEAFRIGNHHCNATNHACGDFVMWYAPSAKFYVKLSWGSTYWPGPLRGQSRLLTSYQLH